MARAECRDLSAGGGSLLLPETQVRVGFSVCFHDPSASGANTHSVSDLVSRQILGMWLGSERLNDHDDLQRGPLLPVLVGKGQPKAQCSDSQHAQSSRTWSGTRDQSE